MVAPGTYPENLLISGPTQIVISGHSNTNESRLAETLIQGTVTVNFPLYLRYLTVDGGAQSAVIVNTDTQAVGGVTVPAFVTLGVELRNSNTNITQATLELNCPTNGVARVDNGRVRKFGWGSLTKC
uniref:Uncharacterized protein n=1 Tax=viral metagenome TaxID=1070528 RepID=A0A6C0BN00_9ZZZZ